MLQHLIQHPRKVFLLDGLGALLSAIMLGGVLTAIQPLIGLPSKTLYGLAGVAGLFCLYSLTCYRLNLRNWRPFLMIIAAANTLYGLLSLLLVIDALHEITALGLTYFILEVIILAVVVYIEVKTIGKEQI